MAVVFLGTMDSRPKVREIFKNALYSIFGLGHPVNSCSNWCFQRNTFNENSRLPILTFLGQMKVLGIVKKTLIFPVLPVGKISTPMNGDWWENLFLLIELKKEGHFMHN